MSKSRKLQITALPNLFSYLRILLVPEFVWLYFSGEREYALFILLLSSLTDFIDGRAARELDLVTPIGRIADPVADKLTQLALIYCLSKEEKILIYLLIILAVKDISALLLGTAYLMHGGKPFNSMWYGKMSTVMLYATGMLLLYGIPGKYRLWIILPTFVSVALSFILYGAEFVRKLVITRNRGSN